MGDVRIMEMTEAEYKRRIDCAVAEAREEATHIRHELFENLKNENEMLRSTTESLKATVERLKEKEKQHILLHVRYDQLLRTSKELAQCLQYETGNGFIN